MRNTWRHFLRRLAATSVVGGSMAWSSAMCYAVQLAYDDASDPVYNNGWQAGDDGGTGILGPWNFNPTYNSPVGQAMDDGAKTGPSGSSPYNDIGRAWTLYNPNAPNASIPPGPDNTPSTGTDIGHAGRAILGDLPVGATLKVVVDNPAERRFFRGWTMRLNTGDGNSQFGLTPKPRFSVGTFDYFTYGQWYMTDVEAPGVPLYLKDDPGQVGTDSGLRIEFTLTGVDTFTASMIPLDNPGAAFTTSGMLETDLDGNPNNGNDNLLAGLPLDWIELEFYNTDSDFYPMKVPSDARATDFYIRSIEITDASAPGQPGDYNGDGTVTAADYVARRKARATFGGDPVGYNTWRENFGEGGAGGSGAVPEPVTFVYLVAGAIGLGSLAVRRGRSC